MTTRPDLQKALHPPSHFTLRSCTEYYLRIVPCRIYWQTEKVIELGYLRLFTFDVLHNGTDQYGSDDISGNRSHRDSWYVVIVIITIYRHPSHPAIELGHIYIAQLSAVLGDGERESKKIGRD